MAERRIPAMGAADTGRVVFHAQMRFPGGCEVFYARAVKLDDYDIADETEIARSACYSQVGESVCGNTVVPDAAEVVRRVANIRRRL